MGASTRRIHRESHAIELPLAAVDLGRIRLVVSGMMDCCQEHIQRHCLDTDDIVLDRRAVLSTLGAGVTGAGMTEANEIPLTLGGELQDWLDVFNRSRLAASLPAVGVDQVQVDGLIIDVLVEPGLPVSFLPDAGG